MAGISSYPPVTDLKKLTFSDQFLSSTKKKVVSRFGLGVMLSFIVLSVLLCNISYKGPFLTPVFNGFSSFRSNSSDNSSIFSWPFPGGIVSLSNDTSILKKLDHPVTVNEALEANVAEKNNKSSDSVNLDGEYLTKVFEDSHMVNGTDKFKDEGLYVGEASFGVKTDERNGTISVGATVENKNVTVIGNVTGEYGSEDSTAKSVEDGVGKKGDGEDSGFLGMMDLNTKKSLYDCDIFNGLWVRDDTKPYYPASSCPFIDRDFDCHLNGRLDSEYVKWRWQPYECDIPRLNTTDFLERLRGKKLVFVGDSLNRNMWESLVCVLRHGVKDQKRVYEISGRHEFKKKGFYAFLFEDYNCTVDFVSSPFLVKESSFNGKNGSFETLRLDLMDQTTSMYHDADVIIFNTGHWWTHEKTSRGEDYYQEGNYVHPRLKVLEAYKRALATWARWVDTNIDQSRTQVIYRGYSVTHFRGGPWNSGGQCHKETEPIFNETYLAKYPSKMKILEYVLKEMKTPVTYLNISRLTDYRKDGHPSIYRPDYQAAQQEVHAQDCSHWCLPGVPDTWNHLLYVTLLKGLWKD